jgi:hypothetical protein
MIEIVTDERRNIAGVETLSKECSPPAAARKDPKNVLVR